MRIAAAIFVAVHGFGHVVWFMATWTRSALGKEGRAELEAHRPGFVVDPDGASGKLAGLASLAVVAGFGASAWGIWSETSWWPEVLIPSIITSAAIVVLMWNPMFRLSVRALLADAALVAATFMPWGDRVLGAH